MTIVRILYNEDNLDYDLSYHGVEVVCNEPRKFFTGNVVSDFRDAIDYAETSPPVMLSSACDHFVDDFAEDYEWTADELIVKRKKKCNG